MDDSAASPTPPAMRHARALLLVNGEKPAQILRKRIVQQGTLADGTTLRLNAFVNHQIDCMLVSNARTPQLSFLRALRRKLLSAGSA